MIFQVYTIFFFIALILIFLGYYSDTDVLKIVGYGLTFILAIMLFQPAFYGSVESCEYLGNYTNNVYSYGENYTGYHWDYDYTLNPSESTVRLFHVKSYPTYNYTCQDVQSRPIGFWIALLSIFGFISVYLDRKNTSYGGGFDDD